MHITARGADQLVEARAAIIKELEEIGYYQPHDRVQVLADIDIGSEAAKTNGSTPTCR